MTDEAPKKKKKSSGRRGFFGELLKAVAAPLVEIADERFNLGIKDLRDHVRPPGSRPEGEFLKTCTHSGYCVEACPVKAIVPLPEYKSPKKYALTPVVLAESQPCVMCHDLACMSACPTGAILPTGRDDMRMGLAVWDPAACTRGKGGPVGADAAGNPVGGDDCNICVEKCPLGDRVIRIDSAGRVRISEKTCTGCGVCTFHCPTTPKAVRVEAV
jgi:ferredoxin-type protein NapG